MDADTQPPGFDYGEIAPLFEDEAVKEGHISFGPLDPVFENYVRWKKQLAEAMGLTYLVENRVINSFGDGARINDNELNLIARWEAVSSPRLGTHALSVWGQFAQSVGHVTGTEFQADLGILSPLCGCNGGPGNTNEILQMLGNNTVAPYTALLGLGVFGQWKSKTWYLSGLVRATDTETGLSADALNRGDLAFVAEFAVTPTIPDLGYGEYRITYSFDEAADMRPAVSTIGFSFDQDIGDRVGAFFKFNVANETFRAFDQQLAAGFQLKKPFGYEHDRFGFGVWWGNPANDGQAPETGTELFYKAQIRPFLEVTPNVQLVFNPVNSTKSVEAVAGLRLRGTL